MNLSQQFLESGFAVLPASNMAAMEQLRGEIFSRAKEVFGGQSNDPETFFNRFHERPVTGAQLNELRVKLIQRCTHEVDSGRLVYEGFKDSILELLGPDLLVQKNTNLVIQQPNDPNPSEVHRDAPLNSPYEITVWIPLVHCYRSKCLYLCDRKTTEEGLRMLGTVGDDWQRFEGFCLERGIEPDVPFGSAIFFWPGLFHGSRINAEPETRWSLNLRYKNLFAPSGLKDPFEFFKVFQLSPIAKLALDFQKRQVLQ